MPDMRYTSRRLAVVAVISTGLVVACSDVTNPGAAPNAAIRVSASTTGPDPDDDGYVVTVDGGAIPDFRIGANGWLMLDSLWEGSYALWLGDIADNCTVTESNPRRVVVATPNATVTADFAVTCAAKGILQITNATTGSPPDPDGYTVRLERGSSSASTVVPAGGTVNIRVTPGSYVVSILRVAANCIVTAQPGEPAGQVDVASGTTVVISFAVTCASVPLPQLAFVRGGRIYGVNFDGTGLVRLSDGPDDADPAWSPDGRRIAFARTVGHDPYDVAIRDIHVMDADGSHVVRLTRNGYARQPSWSADGHRIAFAGRCDGQGCVLVTSSDAEETNVSRLGFDRGFHDAPAWSPDGSKIAFTSDRRAYDILYDLYVMNADGSGVTALAEGPFSYSDGLIFYFQPAWSPDGRRIAVVVCGWDWDNCYPQSGVAIMNADGSGLTTVATAGGFARPTWSPNGTQLAFSSAPCRTCSASIYLVQADGSDRRLLLADGHSPAWRP